MSKSLRLVAFGWVTAICYLDAVCVISRSVAVLPLVLN